jgi:hypothetical protein
MAVIVSENDPNANGPADSASSAAVTPACPRRIRLIKSQSRSFSSSAMICVRLPLSTNGGAGKLSGISFRLRLRIIFAIIPSPQFRILTLTARL